MSKIIITPSDKQDTEKLLTYVESLGLSFKTNGSALIKGVMVTSYDIKSKDALQRHQVITDVCRKLDTLNITYEVKD